MRTMNETLQDFMQTSSVVAKKNLSEEECAQLLSEYQDSVKRVLIENGYVQVSEQVRIDVVKLKKRVHVLRGQSYTNHRNFKLKTRIGYAFYKDILESFNDILIGD